MVGQLLKKEIVIRFLGEGNGLKPMHPPYAAGIRVRVADEEGYDEHERRQFFCNAPKLQWRSSVDHDRTDCFRIRTRRDAEGKLIEAYYGKIYGDIDISGVVRHLRGVHFTYYLNPRSLDRNLEWDIHNNLNREGSSKGLP